MDKNVTFLLILGLQIILYKLGSSHIHWQNYIILGWPLDGQGLFQEVNRLLKQRSAGL